MSSNDATAAEDSEDEITIFNVTTTTTAGNNSNNNNNNAQDAKQTQQAAAAKRDAALASQDYQDALEDVHTRFILNLPPSELETADRIFFQLEQGTSTSV